MIWQRLRRAALTLLAGYVIVFTLIQIGPQKDSRAGSNVIEAFGSPGSSVTDVSGSSKSRVSRAQPQLTSLLTLFTTFRNHSNADRLHRALVRNWDLLPGNINLILFSTELPDGEADSLVSGTRFLHLQPKANRFGVPFLKSMYSDAAKRFRSDFYGYVNGDIFFDNGVIQTVSAVRNNLLTFATTILIGRRTTCGMSDFLSLDEIRPENLRRVADKIGSLDRADAEDYFLVTADFPWQELPDVVVGRKSFDNYVVWFAITHNFTVIDVTGTVLALHVNVPASQGKRRLADHLYNKWKLGDRYDYKKSMTVSAPYATHRDKAGDIRVEAREPFYD